MIGLLDTSVVVDLLRAYSVAESWLKLQGELGLARAVWFEILEGVENRAKERLALQVLRRFSTVDMTPADQSLAVNLLVQYRLSHGVDGYDCSIAAVCLRLQLPLYTHNLKHFTPMLGEQAVKPY